MTFASQNMTMGQMNALIKNLGGEKIARGILDGTLKFVVETLAPVTNYELYHQVWKVGDISCNGYDLQNHLRNTGLLDRALSLESEIIKGWLASPETYPEELKGIEPLLWGSAKNHDLYPSVPYLIWESGLVRVRWGKLGCGFRRSDPALLAK